MSSKSKRRVTVDTSNAANDEAETRKLSVFERLGGHRSYESENQKKCRPYLLTGVCPYGSTCKYKHVQLSSKKSKSRDDESSSESLRLKLKGSGQTSGGSGDKRRDSDSESHDPHRPRRDKEPEMGDRSLSHSRREKETKLRSQVVVKKSDNMDTDDSEGGSESHWFQALELKNLKELELEQKRLQLQRELSQLEGAEEDTGEGGQKKVPVPQSSDSSPDRGRVEKAEQDKQTSSLLMRGRKEKKKHRTKSPPEITSKDKKSSSPLADRREHKKRHEEEEGHKKHKKNKKDKRLSHSQSMDKKKKGKGLDEVDAGGSRIKRTRSSSSSDSSTPPRSKVGKGKGKGKKKKRSGKDAGSGSDDSPKSKKWLSPLKKTLKLKKKQGAGSASGDTPKDSEGRSKHRSTSPSQARHDAQLDESARPHQDSKKDWETSRGSRDQSMEKRGGDKKHGDKGGRRSASPSRDRGLPSGRRGEGKDVAYDRRGRHSNSPVVPGERERSKRPTEPGRERDAYDRRFPPSSSGRGGEREGRKGDDRGLPSKRGPSPPPPPLSSTRPGEMYSPSQLDRESPAPLDSSRGRPDRRERERDREREPPREDDRRGGNSRDVGREGRRPLSPQPADRAGQDRYSRRSDAEPFDQYTQERGVPERGVPDRVGPDRGGSDRVGLDRSGPERRGPDRGSRGGFEDRARGEFPRGGPEPVTGDRDTRGRRIEPYDQRGPSGRDRPRDPAAFERPESGRPESGRSAPGVRESSRERERARESGRDRGDLREREGRGGIGDGKFGGSAFGSDGQRRSGQWEGGSRSAEWGNERQDTSRDLPGGRLDDRGRGPLSGSGSSSAGRVYRDDGREAGRGGRGGRDLTSDPRQPAEGPPRPDRGDRLDRPVGAPDRDVRVERDRDREGRLDRGDGRLERGEGRVDRGVVDRGDGRPERERPVDGRLDRDDTRMDRRRDDPLELRGQRPGRGPVPPGPADIRSSGSSRVPGTRSPDRGSAGFEFDRPGSSSQRDPARLGERDLRLDRDRDSVVVGTPSGPRDRFEPPTAVEFRRDDPRGFRDDLPDGAMRERRVDERFGGPDARGPDPRGGRRFDDVRDDRVMGRGGDDRQRGERLLPSRRSGPYDFDRQPGGGDLPPGQRRGPLLPTPPEDMPRHGGDRRGEGYDRDVPRGGRDAREDRGPRRDRDGDFPLELGRDERGRREDFGREFGGRVDPLWEREQEAGKEARERELGRERESLARSRGRVTPTMEDLALDRDRARSDLLRKDRERSPRREGDKGKEPFALDRDRREEPEQGRDKALDTRSTRSAEEGRDRVKPDDPATGKASSLRGGRDRDAQSDGKRSPARSQGGRERSPLSLPDRRGPPKRTRSLSPKQRRQTPPAALKGDHLPSTVRMRSPGRRVDNLPSPLAALDRRARSRTPVGIKRRLEEDLMSPGPKVKDDGHSPLAKRAREESRSPGRRGSRVPSPAGSHHSRGSRGSVEPRRQRPGSGQRDEGRVFGQRTDRDSPAIRDRDREQKPGDFRGEQDMSRKRGRSPIRSRGSDSSDRAKKRWRGDGSWSETETMGDVGDRQKSGSVDPSRPAESGVDGGQRGDISRTPPAAPPSVAGSDSGRTGIHVRSDTFGAQPGVDMMGDMRPEARVGLAVDEVRNIEVGSVDGGDDNKDLKNMLSRVTDEDDYEKISSDESDFEADEGEKQAQNIVSVLDIDWASLAKEAPPKQTTGSLVKRFHPASIFSQIGVSRALAGPALFDKVKAICQGGVKVDGSKDKDCEDKENKTKEESDQNGGTDKTEPSSGQDLKDEKEAAPKANAPLLSDVPVMHMGLVRQRRDRANLLRNLGPFRKALCARRDLEIRRQMCKVDKVYEQPTDFPTHVMDTYLCKLSVQLFRQGRDFVDRKDSDCEGKTELII